MRYLVILLKSEEVRGCTEMTHISANSWIKRFKTGGISGLETRLDCGYKLIMDCSDKKAVRKTIEQDKQSVKKAKDASPHLNIAETLWWILKGKWLRSTDYLSTDSLSTDTLLYATNRALAAIGSELCINFAHAA